MIFDPLVRRAHGLFCIVAAVGDPPLSQFGQMVPTHWHRGMTRIWETLVQ